VVELSGSWRFQPDPFGEGEKLGYHCDSFDASSWRRTRVPSSFDAIVPELATYEGPGWYRCNVSVPADWRGRRVALRFEGANYRTRVWVNGEFVGENPDGFLPFEFPVHAHLRVGEKNTIAACVDSARLPGEVPGRERGWRPFGGILREVCLTATDPVHVSGLHVRAEPVPGGGSIVVDVGVTNGRDRPCRVEIEVVIADSKGVETARFGSGAFNLAPGKEETHTLEGRLKKARAWSPESPVLYEARATLRADGEEADAVRMRFGLRRIETDGEALLLNGKPIVLRGFNRHEDSPKTGMCTDLDTVRSDILAMKDAGANFVRLAHYPHHPGELDLCDELGLLVLAEIPLYWWCGNKEGEELCVRKLEAARRQLKRMILRDRSHPCIVFWSVSNETGEQYPEVREGNATLIRDARQLDPTRLAVHVSDKWPDRAGFEEDDVLCVNAYPSYNRRAGAANPSYDLAESTGFWQENLARLHAMYPGRPILVTEFGYVSIPGMMAGAIGEDTHARVLKAEFEGMQAPYVCGTTVWCWADHPWPEEDFLKRMTTSPYGVVSRGRKPLLPLAAVREMFLRRRKKG